AQLGGHRRRPGQSLVQAARPRHLVELEQPPVALPVPRYAEEEQPQAGRDVEPELARYVDLQDVEDAAPEPPAVEDILDVDLFLRGGGVLEVQPGGAGEAGSAADTGNREAEHLDGAGQPRLEAGPAQVHAAVVLDPQPARVQAQAEVVAERAHAVDAGT